MITRRNFLNTTAISTGGLMLAPWLNSALGMHAKGKTPTRFIFMRKGNGFLPDTLILPSFSTEDLAKEKAKQAFSADLNKHELPAWMQPIAAHKENLTILQGLSGMMCTTGHHTFQSCLGAFRAVHSADTIRWATVDFELARLFPSAFGHIELACFPNTGSDTRGNIEGVDKGFSARGARQPNYAFGSPKTALAELFKSVAVDKNDQNRCALERELLEFIGGGQTSLAASLNATESPKVANYAKAYHDMREQNTKIDALADQIRKNLPKLDAKYLTDKITTIDRQNGHTEILLSTLISGMTNVIAFTVDELGTTYTGLPGIENAKVDLHDVGHGKSVGTLDAMTVRGLVSKQHMNLINTIVKRLKSVPEADGNMFDNTVLCYLPDNGEAHHSKGNEWPFMILAGRNTRLNTAGRYIRLPKHGDEGHKTLGNLYTTILNAYGNPIKHYGALDLKLESMKFPQQGPISQFLA